MSSKQAYEVSAWDKFLLAMMVIGSLFNVFLFFTEGHDSDKAIIAILFFAIACDQISDIQRNRRVRR